MHNSITSIEDGAFVGCGFSTINIPESVTNIGLSAFNSCESLEAIVLPQAITEINEELFEDCYKLRTITIPKGVTTISPYAFNGCSGLKDLYIEALTPSEINQYAFGLSLCTVYEQVQI